MNDQEKKRYSIIKHRSADGRLVGMNVKYSSLTRDPLEGFDQKLVRAAKQNVLGARILGTLSPEDSKVLELAKGMRREARWLVERDLYAQVARSILKEQEQLREKQLAAEQAKAEKLRMIKEEQERRLRSKAMQRGINKDRGR